MKGIAFALFLLAAAPASAALPKRLPPIDQCNGDPSFAQFRKSLGDVAKRQDSKAFVALFAPETKKPAGYGGDLDPNDVMPAEEWIILETVLRMGCVRSGPKFVIPSMSYQLRRFGSGSFRKKVLALGGAELFDPYQEEHTVLGILNWDVASITNNSGDFWTGIRLPDGRTGFVSDSDLYFLDQRDEFEIKFEKRKGRWMITDFWYP